MTWQLHQIRFVPPNGCIYPRSPSVALGLTAAVALTIAQTILNIATDCICCTRRTFPLDFNQTVALVCSTMSWYLLLFRGFTTFDHSLWPETSAFV